MKLSINGRFLTQSLTGVQRYAAEIVKAMDRLLTSGKAAQQLLDAEWQILVPPDAQTLAGLGRIKVRQVGTLRGHAWDQIDLARAAAGTRLVSLANSGPVLHRDHLVVIHDAQVFRRPDFFSWQYLVLHRSLGHLLARTATIATVSTFSRNELADALSLDPTSIPIVPNSAEHFASVEPDFSIIESLRLEPHRFFLFVGSMTKNKNVDTAVRAAERLGRTDFPLVVVGGDNSKVFGGGATESKAGIVITGRLKDEQVAALFARAAAFVFPSLYEGFGIHPWRRCTSPAPSLRVPRKPFARPALTPPSISTRSTPASCRHGCTKELISAGFRRRNKRSSESGSRHILGPNRPQPCSMCSPNRFRRPHPAERR